MSGPPTWHIQSPPTYESQTSIRLKRPVEIACFSYDEEHIYRPDASSLKYYYNPPIGASLVEGYETFRKLPEKEDEHLDSLLRSIMDLEKRQGRIEALEGGVITWRGMMTKLLIAPYALRDGFKMKATIFQRTIFIEEDRTYRLEQKQQERSRPPPRGAAHSQEVMEYTGYKFETLSLLPAPWAACSRDLIESREHAQVSNYAQYCSIVETRVGDTKLVLGGEVDAVWDSKPTDPTNGINWVELKTSVEPTSPKGWDAFNERKLLKFWAQSFLLGVPIIIVGYRSGDYDARLLRVEQLETARLPLGKRWSRGACLGHLDGFLEWLKQNISAQEDEEGGGGGVWQIEMQPNAAAIRLHKIEDTGHGDILSSEFLAWRRELGARERGDELERLRDQRPPEDGAVVT